MKNARDGVMENARAAMSARLLAEGQRVSLRASGVSMAPTIASGETLRVEPVNARDVQPGDVVLCRPGDVLVVHRVRRIEATRVELQGETAGYGEEIVTIDKLLGRVIAVERNGAWRSLPRNVPSQLRRHARRWRNLVFAHGVACARDLIARLQRTLASR